MTVKIGINGFGRIGRLAFRRIFELQARGGQAGDIEVAAINDLTTPSMLAYLLKYDSTHGTFRHDDGTPVDVKATEDSIIVDGKEYKVYAEKDANNIPWVKNDGVEYVLECTGFYTSAEKSQAHINAGAKKVYFKISNAVDKNGQPADLKYIDFIRVQTGVNAKAGWLGENSTEVFGFTDENINQGK